jgi:hypothetical protein
MANDDDKDWLERFKAIRAGAPRYGGKVSKRIVPLR